MRGCDRSPSNAKKGAHMGAWAGLLAPARSQTGFSQECVGELAILLRLVKQALASIPRMRFTAKGAARALHPSQTVPTEEPYSRSSRVAIRSYMRKHGAALSLPEDTGEEEE